MTSHPSLATHRTICLGGREVDLPKGWSIFRIASLFREVKERGEESLPSSPYRSTMASLIASLTKKSATAK
jgi:hypothetical protein